MVERDEWRPMYPVVVGVDGSQDSARALTWALHEARRLGAPVRVVTAWAWGGPPAPVIPHSNGTTHGYPTGTLPARPGTTRPSATGQDTTSVVRQTRQTQEALVRAVLARFPGALPAFTTELVQGDPASALIERSRDGALLVLGSQGVGGADALVGSVADTCLRHGSCPVVVIPAQSTRGVSSDEDANNRPTAVHLP